MLDRQPEADRSAIVEDVDGELGQTEHLGEAVDDVGDVLERVAELVTGRLLGHAEAGQIRGDDMIVLGEFGDQVAEHVARAREAVQQQHGRAARIAGFAVEQLEAIDIDGVETNGHGKAP